MTRRDRARKGPTVIVVHVEIWPGGDQNRKKTLGTATIANDGVGTLTRGNYNAAFYGQNRRPMGTARVVGFPRKRLMAWDLIFRALRAVYEIRNPKVSPGSGVLSAPLAQLRHAYAQLTASTQQTRFYGTDRPEFNRLMFADGLIAPVIRRLEELQAEGLTTANHAAKVVDR